MSAPGRIEQGCKLSSVGITPNRALGRSDRSYENPRQYLIKTTKRSTEWETVQHIYYLICTCTDKLTLVAKFVSVIV